MPLDTDDQKWIGACTKQICDQVEEVVDSNSDLLAERLDSFTASFEEFKIGFGQFLDRIDRIAIALESIARKE